MKNKILLLLMILLSLKAYAESLFPKTEINSLNNQKLETQVWNAEDSELSLLEKKIINELYKSPKSTFIHYLLSHLYMRFFIASNDITYLNQSFDLAQQAVQLDEKSPFGYIAMIEVLEIMQKHQEAQTILDKAIHIIHDSSWHLKFVQIKILSVKRSTTDTLNDLILLAKEGDVNNDIILPFLVDLMRFSFKESQQFSFLELLKNIHHPVIEQALAEELLLKGNYSSAHHLYKKIIASQNENKAAKINDAEILRRHLKKPMNAIKLLKTIKLEKNSSLQSKLDLQFGLSFLSLKNFDRAKKYFLSLVKTSQNLQTDLSIIIFHYKEMHLFPELTDLLTQIILKTPWFSGLYAELGEIQWSKFKKYDEAKEFYEKAIELEPQRSDYHQNLGLIFYFQKKYTDALLSFEKSLTLDPANSVTLYNKACVLALLNDKQGSLHSLKEALYFDESLKAKALHDPDFKFLHANPQFIEITRRLEI